ncbi:MAG: glycoside hydrolase family 36 N-terminal domain-containing protein, partial [Nakamurella sp.]
MTTSVPDHLHLRRDGVSVLIDCDGPGQPEILHWGADLGELTDTDVTALRLARVPAVPRAVVDTAVPRGLLPERSVGYRGRPGLAGFRPGGADFAPAMQLTGIETDRTGPVGTSGNASWDVVLTLVDTVAALQVRSFWALDPHGLLLVQHEVTNTGDTPYEVVEVGVTLPVPPAAT